MATDLAALVAAPRSDIIPNLLLSPFTIDSYAQAEFEFARRHMEIIAAAAETATDRMATIMLRVANNEIAMKQFVFGGDGFRTCCFCNTNLPFLLWLCLQPNHPQITRGMAGGYITRENEWKIHKPVLELVGYAFPTEKKVTPPTNPPPPTPPLTGATLSTPSENAALATPTSGA